MHPKQQITVHPYLPNTVHFAVHPYLPKTVHCYLPTTTLHILHGYVDDYAIWYPDNTYLQSIRKTLL